jgi:hypothetical protein
MSHLRFDCYGAWDAGVKDHPQAVMKQLGITYQHATPQTIADQWWFWNCHGIPDPLPPYLSELKIKPHKAIGHGLDAKLAREIVKGSQT